jgi:preprotein translocase subunit SecD
VTIFDANLTTVIAALVLYQFGTGPIKGFAVTLTIGLASSMFTAIVVTRLMFDYVLTKYRPKSLSI